MIAVLTPRNLLLSFAHFSMRLHTRSKTNTSKFGHGQVEFRILQLVKRPRMAAGLWYNFVKGRTFSNSKNNSSLKIKQQSPNSQLAHRMAGFGVICTEPGQFAKFTRSGPRWARKWADKSKQDFQLIILSFQIVSNTHHLFVNVYKTSVSVTRFITNFQKSGHSVNEIRLFSSRVYVSTKRSDLERSLTFW